MTVNPAVYYVAARKKRSCEVDPRRSAFLFQASRELCLSAEALQSQYLLV